MTSDPEFHLRPEHNHFIDLSSTIAAVVSLILCLLVLLAAGYIWLHKSARGYLDRISFRLSLWAMVAQILQDVVYITLYAPTGLIDPTTPGCGAGVLFRLALLGIVNYLFTCVAINLMLTIVFGINPVQLRLERWYVGLSVFFGLVISTIPACLKHYGWDPVFGTCYFSSDDQATRVRHFIVDLYLWQILSCIIATVSVAMVLTKLFRQSRATQRLSSFRTMSSTFSEASCPHDSTRLSGLRRLLSRSESTSGCACSPEQPKGAMYQLQDKLTGVALRISLYPVTLIVVNVIVTTGDLWTAVDQGIHTGAAYHMTVFHRLLCGGRGVLFAALCLFVDPCLYRGLRFLLKDRRRKALNAKQERIAKESKSDEDEKTHYPYATDNPTYSPTHLPPGESPPGLQEDMLKLPEPVIDPTLPSTLALSSGANSTTHGGQDRLASNASMDFMQALAGPSDTRPKRLSSDSLDFMSALRAGPNGRANPAPPQASGLRDTFPPSRTTDGTTIDKANGLELSSPATHAGWINFVPEEEIDRHDVERGRSESQMSMDIAQALAFAPAGPSARRVSAMTPIASISEAGSSTFRDRFASDVSVGINEMLGEGPGVRRRGSSAVSSGLFSVLAAGPEARSSRLDSNVSMDIDTALSLGPLASSSGAPLGVRDQPQMAALGESTRSNAAPGTGGPTDPRRPSLPQRWKDAFEEDKGESGVRVVDAGKQMRARRTEQRLNDRARREWMRDLEKLYEEAEAQL